MFGFVVAIVAGFLTPLAVEPLARPAARAISAQIRVEPEEMRLFAFILMMLIAGIAAELLHSGSTFWVILGGALGYFGTRILAMVRAAIDGKPR